MSRDCNGVTFFEPNEKDANHRAFKELSKVSLGDVRFPFGFFLVEEGDKMVVIPGTEDDRRKTLLKAFPNLIPEALSQGCFPNPFDTGCHGGCGKMSLGFRCMRMYDDSRRYHGCGCVDWS